jgi:hypothetical protein
MNLLRSIGCEVSRCFVEGTVLAGPYWGCRSQCLAAWRMVLTIALGGSQPEFAGDLRVVVHLVVSSSENRPRRARRKFRKTIWSMRRPRFRFNQALDA